MKQLLILLFLCGAASAQIITLGPLSSTPIDPSQCLVAVGQTSMCFASDGVHVSIAGLPYTLLPATGVPGPAGQNGANGTNGTPGILVGQTVVGSGTMTCGKAKGTVQSGFVCTFTDLTFKVTSIQ